MYMVSMWVCRVCHTDKSVYMYVHTYCVHIHTYVQCTFETPAACTVCRYIYIQYVMFVVYVYMYVYGGCAVSVMCTMCSRC